MTEIILTQPAFLAAAAHFVSKDATRYYLNGVLIEPAPEGGVFLVATDGHRLVVFHDPNGSTDAPHIIEVPKRLQDACKHKPASVCPELIADSEYIHIYNDNKRVDVQIFSEIDGTYPDWRTVVPKHASGQTTTGIDYSLLSDFQKLISTAYGKSKDLKALRILQNGDGPATILHCREDWFAIIMPMRSRIGTEIPFAIHPPADNDDESKEPVVAAE